MTTVSETHLDLFTALLHRTYLSLSLSTGQKASVYTRLSDPGVWILYRRRPTPVILPRPAMMPCIAGHVLKHRQTVCPSSATSLSYYHGMMNTSAREGAWHHCHSNVRYLALKSGNGLLIAFPLPTLTRCMKFLGQNRLISDMSILTPCPSISLV